MTHVLSIGYAKRTLEVGSREQTRQLELARALETHTMIVFTRTRDGLPEQWQSGNLTVLGTNTKTAAGMIWKAYWLGRTVLKADRSTRWVVSAQDPFATSLAAWPLSWSKNAKFHVQLHGDNFSTTAWRQERLTHQLLYFVGLWMIRRAKKVRVVAERLKRSVVVRGVASEKVVVLPVKISLEKFLPVAATRRYDSETVRFLYAGRFTPEKQLDLLLRSFAVVHEKNPHTALTLLGEGPLLAELKSLSHTLGIAEAVHFMPWTNDIVSMYRTHDVFTLASAHEGYALVLLEAMATGMPVVTTDVGCVGEVVLDGEHGVVSNSEVNSYAHALEAFLVKEKREQWGRAAHRTVNTVADAQKNYSSQWAESFNLS